jgi:serine/threonine protein kinase
VACLGRGSIGAVYRVYDRETDSEVALKTLGAPAPEQLYHLKQEFRALAGIVHPNLVELYELVVTERECFFTMEAVEGLEFVAHVRREAGRLSASPLNGDGLRPFVHAARQLVQGLAAVHSAGKLHRDVKPPNILITQEGRVVLLDFGLARRCTARGPPMRM